MKNITKNKKAEAEWIIIPTILIFWVIIMPTVFENNNETLTKTGTIQKIQIDYRGTDITKITFTDNTTLTLNSKINGIYTNQTYQIIYEQRQEKNILIGITSIP